MIDALIRNSLHARLFVILMEIAVAVGGWFAYRNLTIEAFPDPTDTQVQVITLFPGQPSEEVERQVSIPLERALNGVPGLFRLRSISLFGLSLVTLTFQDGVELLVARQQIMERLPGADLPAGIEPELGPMATPIGEIYRYTLGIVRASEQPRFSSTRSATPWLAGIWNWAAFRTMSKRLSPATRRFDVTVRLSPAARRTAEAIRNLHVPLKDGTIAPVKALADVSVQSSRAVITRENGKRYIGVRMNVRNRDLGSFIAEAQQRVGANVNLPTGYDLFWGGEFENQQRAMKRLTIVLPLALLLTFLLLYSAFGSVWDASIIMLNLPVALLGGLLGLALAGMTLSVSATVGFIALLGQAVLNGVLVVSAIRAGLDGGRDLWNATIEGARERLRAILMTALFAALGLCPLPCRTPSVASRNAPSPSSSAARSRRPCSLWSCCPSATTGPARLAIDFGGPPRPSKIVPSWGLRVHARLGESMALHSPTEDFHESPSRRLVFGTHFRRWRSSRRLRRRRLRRHERCGDRRGAGQENGQDRHRRFAG